MYSLTQYYDVTTNSRWRTVTILKIIKMPYLREKCDFAEIWHTLVNYEQNDSHMTKNKNF